LRNEERAERARQLEKQQMAASIAGGLSVAAQLPRRHYRPPRAVVRGGYTMDWAAETSNFFDRDSRPIMLFDGTQNIPLKFLIVKLLIILRLVLLVVELKFAVESSKIYFSIVTNLLFKLASQVFAISAMVG